MTRPLTAPFWATDADYAAGTDPWSATPTRSEPSNSKKQTGYVPATADAAEEDNWIIGNLSDGYKYVDEAVSGFGVAVKDHFTGNSLDSNTWQSTLTTGATAVIIDDDANSGSGALQLTLGSAGGDSLIFSRNLVIGTGDFRITCCVRKVTLKTFTVGITGSVTFYMTASAGGNWNSVSNAVTTDLGVAPSTTYQFLDIIRLDGVAYYFIDGTLLHQDTDATAITAGVATYWLHNSASAAAEMRLDSVAYWVDI
jgi:hypothetical protein